MRGRCHDSVSRRSGDRSPAADGSGQRAAEEVQRFRDDPVVGETPALLSADQSGIGEDLQVMTHRRLGKAHGSGEIAHARLATRMRADDAEQTESCRVRQHPQSRRQPLGGIFVEGCGQQLRAALGVDRLDELHAHHIDDGRCICQRIDASIDARKEVSRCSVPPIRVAPRRAAHPAAAEACHCSRPTGGSANPRSARVDGALGLRENACHRANRRSGRRLLSTRPPPAPPPRPNAPPRHPPPPPPPPRSRDCFVDECSSTACST